MKKIDAHLHVAQIVAGYCRRGELRAIGGGKAAWGNGEEFDLFPQNGDYGEMNFTVEKALALMDCNGVERAVLMQGSMYGFQNRYHSELLEKYPDWFCPTCTVDPYMADAVPTMAYFFEKKGFRAAKFEVSSGGGLMGCEAGLFLQKTGHEVTVVEMLDRVANEAFGMYREALVWEMEKNHMTMLPKTKCLEITPNSVKIENADGVQELEADTVLYALGMKSVDYSALKEAAGDAQVYVIGDAIHPGKVDQCTRTGYIAALKVGASDESIRFIQE